MKNYWLDRKNQITLEEAGKLMSELKSHWDFNTALGDTIRERYENLYVKIVEVKHGFRRGK